jgi:hypothetical protein
LDVIYVSLPSAVGQYSTVQLMENLTPNGALGNKLNKAYAFSPIEMLAG